MITIRIGEEQKQRAKQLYDFDILKNSFTKGKGNLSGALGEIIVYDYFNKELNKQENTKDYDIILGEDTFDIKTKRCTSTPKEDYNCSVALTSLHQNCTGYIFVRVREDIDEAYILGYISKRDLINKGFYLAKGDSDENGYIVKNDCINIKIINLSPIDEINTRILDLQYIKNNYKILSEGAYIKFLINQEKNIKGVLRLTDNKINIYSDNNNIFEDYQISINRLLNIISNEK